MVSLWPPTELAEGYFYEQVTENYVLSDGSRNLNLYYVHPLAHAEGMLMAYLPAEKMVIEADLVDTHVPLPAAPTPAHRSFANEVRTLNLDVTQIVPIHGKPIPWTDFIRLIGS
jgi:hypothetical protein